MTKVAGDPRFVTFDCYGTLINFEIGGVTREVLGDRLDTADVDRFLADFSAIRMDEVLGPWKPYPNVIRDSLARAMARYGIEYRPSDADQLVEAIPTWGPYPEVTDALKKVAESYPLVILSNADPAQIRANVELIGVKFHLVLTSTEARAYKPRHAAFEYMLDKLACGPDEILHVSSSLRYDIQPADELRIDDKVWLNRWGGTPSPLWNYQELDDLSGLPGLLGL